MNTFILSLLRLKDTRAEHGPKLSRKWKAQLMDKHIVWLAAALCLIPHCRASAKPDGVPHFNMERTCREARAYAGADKEVAYKGCLKDEADAREQLTQKWTGFKQADRRDCVMQGAAPMPSYVELLTCLEMSAEVGALNAPESARGKKPHGPAHQTLPAPAEVAPAETPVPPVENGTTAKPN
ncbi:MAG TPA: hypothetical protein VKE72_03715 [Methylocella sp.]|jgi:hypothetical protein|nr:hypothetical protein [Methylocella sp.]